MNTSFFKSLKHLILGCILCFTFTVLFTSCENFLKANDIRGEIERAIAYNNAPKVNVLIKADQGTGSFLIDGEKEFTVGFTEEELQFNTNKKAIVFQGLEAVSKTDTSISRNDCVQFTTVSNNDDTGVYKIRVKIIKNVDDILIKPKYIHRPAILQYSPNYADYSSEPIKIIFNTPVEDRDTSPDESVFTFGNITIKGNNTSISSCFYDPVLSEDKTILTIIPKPASFNEYLRSQYNSYHTEYTDITVSFDSRTKFNINEIDVQFAEDSSLDLVFHYSTEVELDPPVKRAFEIYKNWDNTTGSDSFDLTLDEFLLDHDTFEDVYYSSDDDNDYYLSTYEFLQNRTRGTVYIYGKYQDTGSGVSSIVVNEIWDGVLNFDDTTYTQMLTKEFTKYSDEVLFWNFSNGITTFCIKYDLSLEDGIISLETVVKDKYANESSKEEKTVVKSSEIDFVDAELVNVYLEADDFDIDYYFENYRDIKLLYSNPFVYSFPYDLLSVEDDIFQVKYGYRVINPSLVYDKIECQYYDDYNELQTYEMLKKELTGDYEGTTIWHYIIPEEEVANINDLNVKIIVHDDIGNVSEIDYSFPSNPILLNEEEQDDNSRIINLTQLSTEFSTRGLIVYKIDDEWKAEEFVSGQLISSYLSEGTEYYIIIADNSVLTGQISTKYTAGAFDFSQVRSVEYESISYSTDKPDYITVNIKLKQDSINYFDTIYATFNNSGKYFLDKGKNTISISKGTTTFFEYNNTFTLNGIKNGIGSMGRTNLIRKITDPKYDNKNPVINNSYEIRYPEHYYISFKDNETGISQIYINNILVDLPEITDDNLYAFFLKINDNDISVEQIRLSENEYNDNYAGGIFLNLYDIIDFSSNNPVLKCNIKVIDKANNETYKKIKVKIEEKDPIYLYLKNGNMWQFYTTEDSPKFSGFRFSNGKWYCFEFHQSPTIKENENNKKIFEPYNIPLNTFIKIRDSFSLPTYYYTGNLLNTQLNDDINPINESTTAFNVYSDAPVLVQTIVVPYSYNICRNWTIEEWEYFKKTIGEQMLSLSDMNNKDTYNVPIDEINTGECYVVIAHFADGTSAMSDVMVK